MHQAGRALHATKDIEVRTHKGMITKLRDEFARDIGAQRLRTLARMQDLRQRIDYEVAGEVSVEDAQDAIREAADFLLAISDLNRAS